MNHSDVRDEQQHALILQLTAERDALKAELKIEQESRISRRLYEQDTECLRHDRNVWKNRFEVSEANNERLRAELADHERVHTVLREESARLRAERDAALEMNEVLHNQCSVVERCNERLRAELAEQAEMTLRMCARNVEARDQLTELRETAGKTCATWAQYQRGDVTSDVVQDDVDELEALLAKLTP